MFSRGTCTACHGRHSSLVNPGRNLYPACAVPLPSFVEWRIFVPVDCRQEEPDMKGQEKKKEEKKKPQKTLKEKRAEKHAKRDARG